MVASQADHDLHAPSEEQQVACSTAHCAEEAVSSPKEEEVETAATRAEPPKNNHEEDDIDWLMQDAQQLADARPRLSRLKKRPATAAFSPQPTGEADAAHTERPDTPHALSGSPEDASSDVPARNQVSAGGPDVELELATSACEEDSNLQRKECKTTARKEQQRRRLSVEGGTHGGMGDYWDEEDELEDCVMRRDLERGQRGNDDSADESSGASQGKKGNSMSGGTGSDDEDDADENVGPLDSKQLNAETQRILRETARTDRIGKGFVAQIQPLTGVLAKILQRKEEAIRRAAQRAPPERTPSATPPSSVRRRSGQRTDEAARLRLIDLDVMDDDAPLIVVESDEEEGKEQEQQREDLRDATESQADGAPNDGSAARVEGGQGHFRVPEARDRAGLLSFMRNGPLEDTQDLFSSQQDGLGPESPAAAPGAWSFEDGLRLHLDPEAQPEHSLHLRLDSEQHASEDMQLRLGSQAQAGGTLQLCPGSKVHSELPAADKPFTDQEEGAAHDGPGAEMGPDSDEEAGTQSGDDADAGDPVAGSEDEASYRSDSSDSGSSDDEDSAAGPDGVTGEGRNATPDSAAKKRALEEARELLCDVPRGKKKKSAFFEDEAEMSEDGGHSDEDEDDAAGGDEHDGLLEDLIGAEQEGRHDEKRRAALHAAWLQQQDAAAVEQLLAGVRNGFRKRRHELDDEGGTHYEAAMRRAALMNGDDDEDEEDGGGSEDEGASEKPEEDLFEGIDALSDEEAREELREAQQRSMLEASQEEEAKTLTLLDDESRAVLGLLKRAIPLGPPVKPRHARGPPHHFASDLTNRHHKASFFGLGASSAATGPAKGASQHGNNTRSYIFGSESSNPASAEEPAEPGAQQAPLGPTSFAGMHLGAGGLGMALTRRSAAGTSNLLGMLHSKALSGALENAASGQQHDDDIRSIIQGNKRASLAARRHR